MPGLLCHQLPIIVELFLAPPFLLQRLPHGLGAPGEEDKVGQHLLPQEQKQLVAQLLS